MSSVLMADARKRLSLVWFVLGGVLFLIVFVQMITTSSLYKDVSEVWAWFLPSVVPTLSLIVGVLIAEAMGKGTKAQSVDSFVYRLGLVLSAVYLLAVAFVILYAPVSGMAPIELMKKSSLALGPFQGIVSGVLALFFTKRSGE